MIRLHRLLRTPLSMIGLPAGLLVYLVTGRTPAWAYRAFVHLFCATGGRSNEAISAIVGWTSSRLRFAAVDGVLGKLPGERLQMQVRQLREQGYLVFPGALPQDMCRRLMDCILLPTRRWRRTTSIILTEAANFTSATRSTARSFAGALSVNLFSSRRWSNQAPSIETGR